MFLLLPWPGQGKFLRWGDVCIYWAQSCVLVHVAYIGWIWLDVFSFCPWTGVHGLSRCSQTRQVFVDLIHLLGMFQWWLTNVTASFVGSTFVVDICKFIGVTECQKPQASNRQVYAEVSRRLPEGLQTSEEACNFVEVSCGWLWLGTQNSWDDRGIVRADCSLGSWAGRPFIFKGLLNRHMWSGGLSSYQCPATLGGKDEGSGLLVNPQWMWG